MSDSINLPANPTHNMVVQVNDGLYLQYDAGARGWFKIVSDGILVPASHKYDGTMSAIDYKKLSRMLVPPPATTIRGEECDAAFSPQLGHIELYPEDFMKVNGKVTLKNVAASSKPSAEYPFKIHRNTSGFDFDLDVDALVAYFISTGQIVIQNKGKKGPTGKQGLQGRDGNTLTPLATGPKGVDGPRGNTPGCDIQVETENFNAKLRPGAAKVAVDARIEAVPGSETDYVLVVDRQTAAADSGASHLNVKGNGSPWVLAVQNSGPAPQAIYYIDISSITQAIYSKYLDEVDRLKAGYEAVVDFWIRTMSTLFDEQKAALCCALEYCQSQIKNAATRQHLESIAATIADRGLKLNILSRSDEGGVRVPVGPNCTNPYAPDPNNEIDDAVEMPIEQPPYRIYDPSEAIARTQDGSIFSAQAVVKASAETRLLDVDPLRHVSSVDRGASVDLPAGTYQATLLECCPEFDGTHWLPLRIAYTGGTTRFPDYGSFVSLADAKEAYTGRSIRFIHGGGKVSAYFSVMPTPNSSGKATIQFEPVEHVVKPHSASSYYEIEASLLARLSRSSGSGGILHAPGQDYVVVRTGDVKVDGLDDFSIAWPTLDGIDFADVPSSGVVRFKANPDLNALVRVQLGPNLGTTLFPVA